MGTTIDQLFYPERLPTPTFGTGGILWASLTLTLLTVPVVIVATEEGLAAIPGGMREASLALGATKSETLWRTVPMAAPQIMNLRSRSFSASVLSAITLPPVLTPYLDGGHTHHKSGD
jgi:ABC-type phosphate transport system permease subunit